MRTPIGRVNKLSLLLLAVLAAAVGIGLALPGSTGDTVEIVAWVAIVILILLELGTRSTPYYGNYYGDESTERGDAPREPERDTEVRNPPLGK